MTTPSPFYIDNEWVPAGSRTLISIEDPATALPVSNVAIASADDVDSAVDAAAAAFASFSQTSVEERVDLLERITRSYVSRASDLADAVAQEIGVSPSFAYESQVASGQIHLDECARALREHDSYSRIGNASIYQRPIGVAALITPWNWPLNQIVLKVAPAIAAGCTMVLKPSEYGPRQAALFAEIMHDADPPRGVFNMVTGNATTGQALVSHQAVDVISFTGSTQAGIAIAQKAAESLKRVTLELGGKSAAIILDDADLTRSVADTVDLCFSNNGQSCDAPTRLLVPRSCYEETLRIAAQQSESLLVGDPAQGADIGPVINRKQFDTIQRHLTEAVSSGATAVTGGPGRPVGLDAGYFVRPTVFGHVTNNSPIARNEIFGPVLTILAYDDEDHAIEIANDTLYGLAGYVISNDHERACRLAHKIDAGQVHINFPDYEPGAPFGGNKRSGTGREGGAWGIEEFCQPSALLGFYR